MGKKYIIELEDNESVYKTIIANGYPMLQVIVPAPYTEPDLDAIRDEAYEKGAQDTKQHWVDAPRTCAYKLGYENGLNDAWEAARKVVALSTVDRRKVFGSEYMYSILENHTASEAIEKIRQYEQEKEKELGIQGYFKNGEEVIDADGTKAVILRVSEDNYCQVYTEKGCIENWHIHTYKFHKTGRHFPEIAAVLAKMHES